MFYRFVFLILIVSVSMDFSDCSSNKVLLEKLEKDNPRISQALGSLREYKEKDQIYMMILLSKQFLNSQVFSESEFDGICARASIPKGSGQSDKSAVAGLLFLTAALDDEHLLLVKKCFEPLRQLYGREDQQLHWQDACTAVMENIDKVVTDHAYLRNRYTLFALGASSKFDNKLAHLILLSAIRHLSLKPEDNVIIERGKEYVLPLFRTQTNFSDFYGILDTLPKIESLDEESLPHAYVLRGRKKVATGDFSGAFEDFKIAGKMRDFEGYREVTMNIPVSSADRQVLIFKAFWMGDETLYQYLLEDQKEKFKVERRIFPILKKFISQ